MIERAPDTRVAYAGTFRFGCTIASVLENGRPLSRANAHVKRPAVATQATVAPK